MHRTILLILVALLPGMTSCNQQATTHPASSSLTDLSMEIRTHKGKILSHTEVLTLGGWMPFPDVGLMYYYASKRYGPTPPPSTAIGISRKHSFKLVGQSQGDVQASLIESIRNDMIQLRSMTEQAIELSASMITLEKKHIELAAQTNKAQSDAETLEKAVEQLRTQRAQLLEQTDTVGKQAVEPITQTAAQKRAAKKLEKLDARLAERRADLLDATARRRRLETERMAISQQITRFRKARDNLEQKMDVLTTAIRTNTGKPGVVVSQWQTQSTQGAGGQLGEVLRASVVDQNANQGFVILGGLRATCLFWGDDFQQMVASMDKVDRDALKFAGITSFVLQAHHIRYVAGIQLSRDAELALSISAEALQDPAQIALSIDQIKIRAYLHSFTTLANTGGVSDWTWHKEPFCFMSEQELTSLEDPKSKSPLTDWNTVVTMIVHMDTPRMQRIMSTWAEKYHDEDSHCVPGTNRGSPCRCTKTHCILNGGKPSGNLQKPASSG